MKRITTNGITNLEPLTGSREWYWGADYASGDLYEAGGTFPQRPSHPKKPACPGPLPGGNGL